MKKHHLEHLFIDALEDLLSDEQKALFNAHLVECSKCARTYANLKSTFAQTKNAIAPQPTEKFWDHYWHNLQYRLDEPKRSLNMWAVISRFKVEQYLKAGLAAAAAIILSIGLYFGELNFRVSDITQKPLVDISTIHTAASSYLERSKILLTSFSNIEPIKSARIHNFDQQKALSRKLVDQTTQLKEELDPQTQKRMLSLIDDLEVVLLQIANIDSSYNLNTIEMIQYSVEQKSILFKLNLQEISEMKTKTIKGEDI
jgi:hypothetical protein